jgi:g-D-glutamyl-meso-diaminopimelate peptidase
VSWNERLEGGYNHLKLEEDLRRLADRYPFVRLERIGFSVLGKPILAVEIGDGPWRVHANAAMHANEWITAPLLVAFLEDYAESIVSGDLLCGKSGAELARATTFHAVPMVNPDGVELVLAGAGPNHPRRGDVLAMNGGKTDFSGWKANVRGVDLNDQFPAFWEAERERRQVTAPGPRDYTGERPLSEPEAMALARCVRLRGFHLVVALHTQGREIYWNYRGLEPPEAEAIAAEMGESSGLKPVRLEGSDAGFKDWFIAEFRRPGFTVELGCGENPLPAGQFPSLYQELLPIMEKALSVLPFSPSAEEKAPDDGRR